MDDFVVFGASKRELRLTHDAIVAELAALGLEPKARATVVAPCHVGLPFLGWRIYRGTMRVRPENLRRSRRRIAVREQQCRRGALDERQLSDAVRSVVAHLRCGDTLALRRRWFASEPSIDDATNTGRAEGSSSNRSNRGGSFNNAARNARSGNRNRNAPTIRNNDLGARAAKTSLRPTGPSPRNRHGRAVHRDAQAGLRCQRVETRRPNSRKVTAGA